MRHWSGHVEEHNNPEQQKSNKVRWEQVKEHNVENKQKASVAQFLVTCVFF